MGTKWNFDRKTSTKITAWLGRHVDRWKMSHEANGYILRWPEVSAMMREEVGIDPPFGFAKTVRRTLESLDLPPNAMVFSAPKIIVTKPLRSRKCGELGAKINELTARIEAVEKFLNS